jgi:hypothetical protein
MRQDRTKHVAGTLSNLASIIPAAGHDAHRTCPASPLTWPGAGIKVPLLLRRYHGEYPLPGMILPSSSPKLTALSPN